MTNERKISVIRCFLKGYKIDFETKDKLSAKMNQGIA